MIIFIRLSIPKETDSIKQAHEKWHIDTVRINIEMLKEKEK